MRPSIDSQLFLDRVWRAQYLPFTGAVTGDSVNATPLSHVAQPQQPQQPTPVAVPPALSAEKAVTNNKEEVGDTVVANNKEEDQREKEAGGGKNKEVGAGKRRASVEEVARHYTRASEERQMVGRLRQEVEQEVLQRLLQTGAFTADLVVGATLHRAARKQCGLAVSRSGLLESLQPD
jgi:hypothetical protein